VEFEAVTAIISSIYCISTKNITNVLWAQVDHVKYNKACSNARLVTVNVFTGYGSNPAIEWNARDEINYMQ
jgi:hypothetical protein